MSISEATPARTRHVAGGPGRGTTLTYPAPLLALLGRGPGVVLCQLTYWINRTNHEVDGAWWVYKSIQSMRCEWFPMYSETSLRRYLNHLEEQGLIRIKQLAFRAYDRTNYYALTAAGAELLAEHGIRLRSELWQELPRHLQTRDLLFGAENGQMDASKMDRSMRPKRTNGSVQNGQIDASKMDRSTLYKEESTETLEQRVREEGETSLTEGEVRSWLLQACRHNGEKKQQDAINRLLNDRATYASLNLALQWWEYDYQLLAERGEKPHWSQLAQSHENMTRGKGSPPTPARKGEDRELLDFLEARYGG